MRTTLRRSNNTSVSALRNLMLAAARLPIGAIGPCAACGARRAAPLCDECLAASAASAPLLRYPLGRHRLHFAGAYHDQRPGGRRGLSPLGSSLKTFKDRGDRYAGRCLSRLFADRFCELADPNSAIVPVPSDAERLRKRGFSPAAWLAHALARRSGARLFANLLVRVDGRPPQRGLDGITRRVNARGAFTLGPRNAQRYVEGHSVILVDDVVTTGATLDDAARCLRDAGAAVVVYAVLACADEEVIRSCRSTTVNAGIRDTAPLRR